MPDTAGLTGLQISILQVLWEKGEATTQEVWKHISRARPLALTTIATLMSRLERKEVLTHRRQGRQYVYRATVTRADVRRHKVRELTATLFDGNPASLLSHLVRHESVEEGELEVLRELVQARIVASGADGD